MEQLSALIIGISSYQDLDGWNIADNRTARDAIAITESLCDKNVPIANIKLFLSMGRDTPTHVRGVAVEPATWERISNFIIGDFNRPGFAASNLFFFCSGHGFLVDMEPCLILADSKPAVTAQATYRCLGLDRFRHQLFGMGFSRQFLCVNTCQVPSEWSPPGRTTFVDTSPGIPGQGLQQVRFLAAPEMQTAPVESRNDGLSNGFAAAVRSCIEKYELPPNASDWDAALRDQWGDLVTLGLYGADQSKFKILRDNILKIDRKKQCDFVSGALKTARDWDLRQDLLPTSLVPRTLLDLHALNSDQLSYLISRLQDELFNSANDKKIAGGLASAVWPATGLIEDRKRDLSKNLAEALVGNDELETADDVAEELAAMGDCIIAAYLEVEGCTAQDRELVKELLAFWNNILAHLLAKSAPTLPLLIVGHVNPDPAPGQDAIDTAHYYHEPTLPSVDRRRLTEIRWQELLQWLDDAMPRTRHPGRGDLDSAIARALGAPAIQSLRPFRMATLVDFVTKRAG
ncbi:hypothetical protein JJB99_23385 [Bradyrhizobium diazoefficiens]|uniref:hypothetical protein n=1 Tax=Bradyrhizobium diazoefficiens TaxID=1355477 RepID=UPI00190E5428|nr:hypothetical protein [Bradyrhizobium diazoefficiens]QQO12416.1 hypothetical protein JJB99_23385 [Bradyrhizobium diazoefficiens]